MAPIIESRRKDMEALVEANKATYDAMQALARKQTEILTQANAGDSGLRQSPDRRWHRCD
jgi:hypothetical protein